jgi:hypothetical protein
VPDEHPLLSIYLRAARGDFPPADGQAIFLPSLQHGQAAVVSFTGRAYLATSLAPGDFAEFALDGYGSAIRPNVLARLASPTGHIFLEDMTLVGRGQGGGSLRLRDDLEHHIRVRYARTIRRNVQVYGDERGFITLSNGLAGRPEMSIELSSGTESRGTGRALIAEALKLTPPGEPLFAAVSPGNARSVRAFLAMGFVPIGSEVIIDHRFTGREP